MKDAEVCEWLTKEGKAPYPTHDYLYYETDCKALMFSRDTHGRFCSNCGKFKRIKVNNNLTKETQR
jgi:hypothetical protein